MEGIRDHVAFSFVELESIVWEEVRKGYQEALQALLETLDRALAEARDSKRFVLNEKRRRLIQTRVGEVPFERRYYWDTETALDWAHHGHFPALGVGQNASGGLSRVLRRVAYAAPNA